jgi:hypothetical protein
MIASKVEVMYYTTEKDEKEHLYSITYYANEKGIVAEQDEEREGDVDDEDALPNHKHILPVIPDEIQKRNDALVTMLVNILEPDGFKLSIYDSNDDCFIRKSYDFDEDRNVNKDGDYREHENMRIYDDKITDIICCLITAHKRILKEFEIKDKECPVLHTPLTIDNSVKLKKCGHYLSLEAWLNIKHTLEKGETETFKKCPLCRALHNHCDYD